MESYRSLKTPEEFKNHALYIKDTFVVSDGKYEANTSGKIKNEVLKAIEKEDFNINLFDRMDADILFTMRIETYEKFLHSDEFQEFLMEQDGKKNHRQKKNFFNQKMLKL